MGNEHILVRQGLGIVILDGQIPQLHCCGVARIQGDGVKRLRDGRLLHGGKGVAKDILLAFLAPVHFGGGILYPLTDGTPHRGGGSAGIEVSDEEFSGDGLAGSSVKFQISHYTFTS